MVPTGQEGLKPGDVLAIGADGALVAASQPFQRSVAGVYSTEPGFIGGSTDDELESADGQIPLALTGIVPVNVCAENGPIAPGDLLTTSSRIGHAMRAGDDPPVGTVIGKAMGSLEAGQGVIQALVMLQ